MHLTKIIILFLQFIAIRQTAADNVFGCGGFVKSDVEINFSLVEVKLYTPHGSIKYQTDCAPKTGYYLIPLYEKGEFVLKVEPPEGWTFEPESVELLIDGEKDQCSLSEDINFIFTGFSLKGKVVSKGQSTGPEGVVVNLYKSGTKDLLQTVQTTDNGSYQFKKVMPGKYDIRATHGSLRFGKSETSIELTDNNADAGSSLVIDGYSVTGNVWSEGEPIKGVSFLLYSSVISKQDVHGCEKSVVPGVSKADDKLMCHVVSAEDGQFTFPCLPTGTYSLVPFYKGEHITFDVEPQQLTFEVQHSSFHLKDSFQVAGFSVTGRVLDSEKGSGIGNADVIVNGNPVTKTAADGTYQLENMKTGVYRLNVKVANIFFDEKEVKITPNTPQLPNIIPISFNLCGRVKIDKFPEGLSQQSLKRKVIIFPEGKGSEAVSKETSDDGSFCKSITPGKYIVRVHMSDAENKAGLTLSPPEHVATITNKPVLNVLFSQFRARVTGTVTCMEKCGPIEVSVESVGRSDKQIIQTQGHQLTSSFVIENVLPGKYKATILKDALCWKNKTIEFEVVSQNVDNLQFTQTGYILKCTISHSISLNFAHDRKEGSVGSFELNKGKNRFCLAEPGLYKLTPDSCHKFEKEVYTYDTSSPETLTLTAVSHLVKGSVRTEEPISDAVVSIRSSLEQSVAVDYPLTSPTPGKDEKAPSGPQTYTFSHWARSGEKLTATVKSAEMLFTPPSVSVTVNGDACPGELFKFVGERGQFIDGRIVPKLAGVRITVTSVDGKIEPVTSESSENGEFRIGPLPKGLEYKVTAEKEGYVMEKEADKNVFRAFKLGRISVLIIDEQGVPLPDVLLSLSGGKQYRSNNLTKEDGSMLFADLNPGQYFLRPMMKEYSFDPASQMIDVLEGTTMDISIKGVRNAYSCYGQVTSLNGEPEQGLFVEAQGRDKCSMYQEESKTDQYGFYRIRGLQPDCSYDVRLKIGEMNKHIERAAPNSRLVMVQKTDFVGVNIIAFRRMNQMDISGNVVTSPSFLNTLKVRLYKEDNPGVPMFTASLGDVSFFYLPSLPIDDKMYTVRLESSLSKHTHDFVQPEFDFKANTSYKHITFQFEAKRKSVEQELSQGSVLFLPFTILIAYAIYNYQKVLPFLRGFMGQVQAALQQRRQSGSGVQQAPVVQEFDIQDSPISKKKNRQRKT